MKVVINRCYGGFGLSHEAIMRYSELSGLNLVSVTKEGFSFGPDYYIDGIVDDEHYWYYYNIERTDPNLVRTVEELGEDKASGGFAELKIVEIPDDVEFDIAEYDGIEWVAEKHRTWS